MEGQGGAVRGPQGVGQQFWGIELCHGGRCLAHFKVAVDGEGRPAKGKSIKQALVDCAGLGEAAVARDLAAHWLRSRTGSKCGQSALPYSYEQRFPALLRQLGGIRTLEQLRARLVQLRNGGTLASMAAALGFQLPSEQAAAADAAAAAEAAAAGAAPAGAAAAGAAVGAAAAGTAAAGAAQFKGVHRSQMRAFHARLQARLDDKGPAIPRGSQKGPSYHGGLLCARGSGGLGFGRAVVEAPRLRPPGG